MIWEIKTFSPSKMLMESWKRINLSFSEPDLVLTRRCKFVFHFNPCVHSIAYSNIMILRMLLRQRWNFPVQNSTAIIEILYFVIPSILNCYRKIKTEIWFRSRCSPFRCAYSLRMFLQTSIYEKAIANWMFL